MIRACHCMVVLADAAIDDSIARMSQSGMQSVTCSWDERTQNAALNVSGVLDPPPELVAEEAATAASSAPKALHRRGRRGRRGRNTRAEVDAASGAAADVLAAAAHCDAQNPQRRGGRRGAGGSTSEAAPDALDAAAAVSVAPLAAAVDGLRISSPPPPPHVAAETAAAVKPLPVSIEPGTRSLPPGPHSVPSLKECCVCLDEVAAEDMHVLMPCMHRCVCAGCSAALMGTTRKCPKCRADVTLASRVFDD